MSNIEMSKNMGSIFCLSLDLELIIGWHDLSNSIYERKKKEMEDARDRIHDLISVLEKNGIKCTWGVTSHLFLESCDGHDDYPDREWLLRDPRTSLDKDPLWYAPDLIDHLLRSDVNFEIGCHSFSHPFFHKIGENQAQYELKKSEKLAKDWAIKLESFIFPGNEEGYKKMLFEFGYKAYRPKRRISYKSKISKALDLILGKNAPEPVLPVIDEYGMVVIPPSIYLGSCDTVIKQILSKSPPRDTLRWYLQSGLEKTVDKGGVFHAWMHPCDYGKRISKKNFEYMINLVKKYEARGELHIFTMSEVAERVIMLKNKISEET